MQVLFPIFDPAHGVNTLGKRSPDGKHLEYLWSRDMITRITILLGKIGYSWGVTNTSDNEIGLGKRVKAANASPYSNKLLISLHNNAASSLDEWTTAHGVECFIHDNDKESFPIAEECMKMIQLKFPNLKVRKNDNGTLVKTENFTVLMGDYKAFLLEFGFQDNKDDLAFIDDPHTKDELAQLIVDLIVKLNTNGNS